jgi:hypothetical protein
LKGQGEDARRENVKQTQIEREDGRKEIYKDGRFK